MTYFIHYQFGRREPGVYERETLADAAYQASKLSDQGADNVRVLDANGVEVDISDAPLPPGWLKGAP